MPKGGLLPVHLSFVGGAPTISLSEMIEVSGHNYVVRVEFGLVYPLPKRGFIVGGVRGINIDDGQKPVVKRLKSDELGSAFHQDFVLLNEWGDRPINQDGRFSAGPL
ncbi:unnamed protein product [Sphagnum jensenii]|uniref:Uncharacterized protein n=1 Tax=Sphagnum jensenii TaxID=128206 RepID=A0ABP1AT18_9BRYO